MKEFATLFRYYKDARLLQLRRTETRLLAVFQIGAGVRDVKVFRWAIDAHGPRHVHGRSRRRGRPRRPRRTTSTWTPTTRDDQVAGPHPHFNILDTVFVETVGGDLTIKVENNTKDGRGIYASRSTTRTRRSTTRDIAYAKVGGLILLQDQAVPRRGVALPRLQHAHQAACTRVDAIGQACHELPEDHGIVFPGGYYLQSGEHKIFDGDVRGLGSSA